MARVSILCKLMLMLLLFWLAGCRSSKPKETPPPSPPLTQKTQLPRRGLPVSDFERLANWQVQSVGGEVRLEKNLSQAIWGWASAEITLKPQGTGPMQVKLIPNEPWMIQSQFDTVLLWMMHQGAAGLRPDARISLHYRDAQGALGEWVLPYQPGPEMQMLHLRIRENLPGPVAVESLIWDLPGGTMAEQKLYLDSLSIYQEVLSSIPQKVHYVRPFGYAPVFAPLRRNAVTLNFPSSANAYRPRTRPEKFLQSLTRLEENRYLFTYQSAGLALGYRISARPGMPGIEVILNGKAYPQLWQGAEVEMAEGRPELRFARMGADRLTLQYTQGLQFEISLHGKTLQVEMNSLLENVKNLYLGRFAAEDGRALPRVTVPFMRLQEDLRWPVYVMREGTSAYMLSCFPDWWYSLASRYDMLSRDGESGDQGRMVYEPRWRGNRNMFRERLYFTVSDRLQDVLPEAASPVAVHRHALAELPWTDDLRLPEINLMALQPLDERWDDRLLARDARGEWREHPQGGYIVKSGLFDGAPMDRMGALRDQSDASVLKVPAVSQHPPWRFMDSDVRSVGAATYTQLQADAGALLQQVEAEWGGPVIGRGGAEWFWSGLLSGILPSFPLGILELHPLLPQFAWRNVHPYTQILGLGPLDDFRLPTDAVRSEELLLNRYLAMQVAYAAMGRIPEIQNPLLRSKSERIQRLLQPRFAGVRDERIAYWNGERFLDAGEAIQQGVLADSQMYIRLEGETEIWVNGNLFDAWQVRVDGRDIVLPPFGFVVRGNDFFVMNLPRDARHDGLCLLETEGQVWVSSPDKEVDALRMRLQGCLQIERSPDGGLIMDIADWHGEARFNADLLKLKKVGSVRGVNDRGEPIPDLHFERIGDEWILQTDAPLRRLWISPEISGREMKFSP